VAELSRECGQAFVVVTSVTRDDLPDGGAAHFAATLTELRRQTPGVGVELLVPDFAGDTQALAAVAHAWPEVLAHNLETVPRLYHTVRRGANYARSLTLLRHAARIAQDMAGDAPRMVVKSGLMLGLGERGEEVRAVMADLRDAGCTALTLGQYLAPGLDRYPVVEYVAPEGFAAYEAEARGLGFAAVAAGPYVRSSYLAKGQYHQARLVRPAEKVTP
jgi:lipoic acid synthetase